MRTSYRRRKGQYRNITEKLGLEGAKGLDDEILISAIKAGIRKVNTDTDLRFTRWH